MEIQGEKILAMPRADVWRALNDPGVLQRCIPGCDTFEPDGENKYRVAMQATVGPVRARFAGKLQLRDVVAPTSYAMSFEGSGGVAGFGRGTANVVLDDVAGDTRLRYEAQAQVGGRLAQVGTRLIDGITKRMADDFFTRFANELAPRGESAGVPAAAVASPTPLDRPRTATPATPATTTPSAQSPQSTQIAVIAAAVSATAAAVAVLAAVFAFQFAR